MQIYVYREGMYEHVTDMYLHGKWAVIQMLGYTMARCIQQLKICVYGSSNVFNTKMFNDTIEIMMAMKQV